MWEAQPPPSTAIDCRVSARGVYPPPPRAGTWAHPLPLSLSPLRRHCKDWLHAARILSSGVSGRAAPGDPVEKMVSRSGPRNPSSCKRRRVAVARHRPQPHVRVLLPEPSPEARAAFARRLAAWAVQDALAAAGVGPLTDGKLTATGERDPLPGEVEKASPPTAANRRRGLGRNPAHTR